MTIPKDCKRLAEVDFPILTVGDFSLDEKAIRIGTPHQLHLWWAWRPLAACRAMIIALLIPDPTDKLCPNDFKEKAKSALSKVQNVGGSDLDLQQGLLKFIGDYSNWKLASNTQYTEVAREIIHSAHDDISPLVLDSFSGSGSISLEAIRVGCEAYSSDLNPVANFIQSLILQDIQKYGREKIEFSVSTNSFSAESLSEALSIAGREIKTLAEKDLIGYYPPESDGSNPIAYLWARTVRCESPNCGAEIPLIRSPWLSKKASRKKALNAIVFRGKDKHPHLEFEIISPIKDADVMSATVNRSKATCLCCGAVLSAERVRAQLSEQSGGADVKFDKDGNRIGGALLLAVVTIKKGEVGRRYRIPTVEDYKPVWMAMKTLDETIAKNPEAVPNEPMPPIGTLGFRIQRYGVLNWGGLYTYRQLVSLLRFTESVKTVEHIQLKKILALTVSKLSERSNSLCDWMTDVECPGHLFTQQIVPPGWDFAEGVPISESSGSFISVVENTLLNIDSCYIRKPESATVQLLDAAQLSLPDETSDLFFTDPPYYDAVPYSDLSDFFFVWLKRMLNNKDFKDPFDSRNPLTPKDREAVQDSTKVIDGKIKDKTFFEDTMSKAFSEGRRTLKDNGIGCVVFAHKTTEGWEALLTGMINGGWIITSSWPITTERSARMRAKESAALATSVHLICRPRPENAEIGDWTQVSRELPRKVGDWMQRLQTEGVRGADLVFACIGPALEIYSRYSKVVDAEDREIPLGGDPEAREPHLRGYLAYVWEVVGRLALEQVLGSGDTSQKKDAVTALEEDARLTALFLWTQGSAGQPNEKPAAKATELEEEGESEAEDEEEAPKKKSKGGYSLPFDVVRRFAQPLGIHLPEWEHRIIETDKGVVTLLSVKERAQQLFGEEGASAFANEIEEDPSKPMQMTLFAEAEVAPKVRGRRKSRKEAEVSFEDRREATTLDRLHAAMLLQKNGQTNALRALLQAESERGSDFMRLANALSALYPRESEEKRLLDAVLVNVKR